jgi:phenylalanyl-tRNA synthetase beta chain
MKISRAWIQKYFDTELAGVGEISDAYTFHAFEIDATEGEMLDVKVLPNRAADCMSHRGLAKELSAILDIPLKADPLRTALPDFPTTNPLSVTIEDGSKCLRYMGALVTGVKVGPSPAWLKEAIEAVGQRSINNVVDATNYVMLNIGQPLHAFDADKLAEKDGAYSIAVRSAKEGEKITTLSNEEYALNPNILLIADANADAPLALAGIKGGKRAEVTAETTSLIVESANFEGTLTRRSAQALKLFTDASVRFQNRPSAELAAYGMRDVLALIKEIAGGEVAGVVDQYPTRPTVTPVSVTLSRVNGMLGTSYTSEEVLGVCKRLDLPTDVSGETFTVTPPFERVDLVIPEDLVEEVGRIIGYDKIAPTELPPISGTPDQARYRGIEKMKDQFVEQGYTEVSTQSFAAKGDIVLANPLDKAKPALRTSLEENLNEALAKAKYNAPLVLAPKEKPKLFEVGSVFPKEGEYMEMRMTERVEAWGDAAGISDNLSVAKFTQHHSDGVGLEDYGKDYEPKRYELSSYKPFSLYPFITRDIALWVPAGTEAPVVEKMIIRDIDGSLLARLDQFDQFEKEGRISYAFRLVFQSFDRTLTDDEVNGIMSNVTEALTAKGYEVR